MDEYAGKKAVVTGGTQGMGLAMVRALLGGGAKVLLTGRNEKNLEAARAELGPGAGVLRSDAASRSDIDELGEPIEKAALARFLWASKALARYRCAASRPNEGGRPGGDVLLTVAGWGEGFARRRGCSTLQRTNQTESEG